MKKFCFRKEKFALLLKAFPAQYVETLEEFLKRTQTKFNEIYINESSAETSEVEELLKKCVVVTPLLAPPVPPLSRPQSTQQEIVKNAIIALSVSNKQRRLPTDLLALGCVVHYGRQVDVQYPNTIVNFVLSKPWEKLLHLVGDDLMFYLLRHTTLLFELSNGCYMQLTGTPLKTPTNKKFRKYFVEPARRHLSPAVRRLISQFARHSRQAPLHKNISKKSNSPSKALSKENSKECLNVLITTASRRPQCRRDSSRSFSPPPPPPPPTTTTTTTTLHLSTATVNATHTSVSIVAPSNEHPVVRRRLGVRGRVIVKSSKSIDTYGVDDSDKNSVALAEETTRVNDPKTQYVSGVQNANANSSLLCGRPDDRRKSKSASSLAKIEFKEIPRFKIFYANVHNRQRGLPKSHILNQLSPTVADAEKLARQIFRLKVRQRLPPRVKNLVPLLLKVLRRHRKCNYTTLLEYHCPFPMQRAVRARQQKSLLPDVGGASIEARTDNNEKFLLNQNNPKIIRYEGKNARYERETNDDEFKVFQRLSVAEEPPRKKRKGLTSAITSNDTKNDSANRSANRTESSGSTHSKSSRQQNFLEESLQTDAGHEMPVIEVPSGRAAVRSHRSRTDFSMSQPNIDVTKKTAADAIMTQTQCTASLPWSLSNETRREWKQTHHSERRNVSLLPLTPRQVRMKHRMFELSQESQERPHFGARTELRSDVESTPRKTNTSLSRKEVKERSSTPFELSQSTFHLCSQRLAASILSHEPSAHTKEPVSIKGVESVGPSFCSQTLAVVSPTPPPTQTPASPSLSISSSFELTQHTTKDTNFHFIKPRRPKVPANRNLERLLTLPTTQTLPISATAVAAVTTRTSPPPSSHSLSSSAASLSSEHEESADALSSSSLSVKMATQSLSVLRESPSSSSLSLSQPPHTQLNNRSALSISSSTSTSSHSSSVTLSFQKSVTTSVQTFDSSFGRKRRRSWTETSGIGFVIKRTSLYCVYNVQLLMSLTESHHR
jgi:hypothetical protein